MGKKQQDVLLLDEDLNRNTWLLNEILSEVKNQTSALRCINTALWIIVVIVSLLFLIQTVPICILLELLK